MEAGDKWWLVTDGKMRLCAHTCEHERGVEKGGAEKSLPAEGPEA